MAKMRTESNRHRNRFSSQKKDLTEPPTFLPTFERKYDDPEENSLAPQAVGNMNKVQTQTSHSLSKHKVTQTPSLLMEDFQRGHLHRQHPCFRALVTQPWLKKMLFVTLEGLIKKMNYTYDFMTLDFKSTSCLS